MSGLVGCITESSKEFNDLGNNPVDGMKKANQIHARIVEAEREQAQVRNDDKIGEANLMQGNLVASIRQDIEDSRAR